jgi:hypothetical protein
VSRVSQSALFAGQRIGFRRWPLVVAALGAAVLSFGAAQSLAFDLRAATSALASVAPPAFGALVFAGLLTLIVTAPRRLIETAAAVLAAGVALSVAAAFVSQGEPQPLAAFGQAAQALLFVALVGAASGSLRLALKARESGRAAPRDYRSWLILAFCTLPATAAYVLGSTRILAWDPIQFWSRTDWVATQILSDPAGTIRASLLSAADEYSMIPALLPGALTALAPQSFLLGYMLAIALCYFIPALLACGGLGLALARSAQPDLAAAPKRRQLDLIAVGAVAAIAALPAFVLAFLDSAMLDSGGVVLLAGFAWLWTRLLKLIRMREFDDDETTHAWDVLATAAALAALALLIFTFRRWYIFDVLGFSAAALLYLLVALWRLGGSFRDRLHDLALAGASALLVVLLCGEWIVAQWIINADKRLYAESYAAFWPGWSVELGSLYRNLGIAFPLLCLAGLVCLAVRRGANALPFLLLAGTLFAVVGFFCVQGMSPHHYYIFLPALAASAAAGGILIAHRLGVGTALAALITLLCLMTLAPRIGALDWVQPAKASLWPTRIVDAEEFRRLGHWLDRALGPEEHYCLAASSWHVNGSVMSNIWQLDFSLKGGAAEAREIVLPGVDTRDGPPNKRIQECAIMLAATPPQTHLRPEDQQAILLVDHELLTGDGIGRAYERMGEEFHLSAGVTLIAYRRARPLADDEVTELRRRFYATKGVRAQRFIERFDAP